MASIRLKVTYTDGTSREVNAGPRAQVELERKFEVALGALDEKGTPIEYSYFMAWAALHFAGQEAADFDDFLNRLEEVEQVALEAANPTQTAPPSETSSDSPSEPASPSTT